jgi:hypothetical protein
MEVGNEQSDVVKPKIKVGSPIGDEMPELLCGPLSWSLRSQTKKVVGPDNKLIDIPLKTMRYTQEVDLNKIMLKYEHNPLTADDAFDVEKNTIECAKRQTRQTSGQRMFISTVNTTCGNLFVEYASQLRPSEYAIQVPERQPRMADIHVLYQSHLMWKQGSDREIVTDVYLPICEPYGGAMDDFSNATFEEEGGRRVFGTAGVNYTEWAELDVGMPVFLFSCYSVSGWYTYLYSGPVVRCVGREKFRGIVFERDEVIYSLDSVSSFKLNDVNRPIVNLNWKKYPMTCDGTIHRVVCRNGEGDSVIVCSTFSASRGIWPSKCTIEQIQEMYKDGRLAPNEKSKLEDLKYLDDKMINLQGEVLEIHQKVVNNSHVLIPDQVEGLSRSESIMTLKAKHLYIDKIRSINAEIYECQGDFTVRTGNVEQSYGKVTFYDIGGVALMCLTRCPVRINQLGSNDFTEVMVLEFQRVGNVYGTTYLPWYYRTNVSSTQMKDQGGGLQFKFENCGFRAIIKPSFLGVRMINMPRILIRSYGIYYVAYLSVLQ